MIPNAVYGDLAEKAVVNLTRKGSDWIEDSLSVEAIAGNFGDTSDGIEKQPKVDCTGDGADGTTTIEERQLLKIGNRPRPKVDGSVTFKKSSWTARSAC